MRYIALFREAYEIFQRGENVSQHFKDRGLSDEQKLRIIEFAYDLQSGSYMAALESSADVRANKQAWGRRIGEILVEHGASNAIEAGVGEATTLRFIIEACPEIKSFAGFDMSVSRLGYARHVLKDQQADVKLFVGDLCQLPLIGNAYDVVLTNHSVEPNGGRERQILAELLRTTRRFLVMVEPDFERGSDEQKERMATFGYVRDLPKYLEALGAKILRYEPWGLDLNPLNAASLIVAEKPNGACWNAAIAQPLASPYSKAQLSVREGYLFSEDDLVAFPVIDGFPHLLPSSAIVASHLSGETLRSLGR